MSAKIYILAIIMLYASSTFGQWIQEPEPPRLIIILLDETDSFGQNTTSGVAETMYWDDALKHSQKLVKQLKPGDEIVVLAIDEQGFEEEDILVPYQQLEKTFLKARVQQKHLSKQILKLKRRKEQYRSTDILGALYQAAYFANQEPERETLIFCFSDMRQEPNWPTLADAKGLAFTSKTTGYFFFVDADGKTDWDKIIGIWRPIFQNAGLIINSNASLNFFQHGESTLHLNKIVANW